MGLKDHRTTDYKTTRPLGLAALLLVLWSVVSGQWSVIAQVSRQVPFFNRRAVASTNLPPMNDLVLWARPESVTNTHGGKLPFWVDSSGKNNHITNSVAADQFTVLTNQINGFSAAHADGTTNSMFVPSINLGTNWTLATIYKEPVDALSYKPLFWNSNTLMAAVSDSANGIMQTFDGAAFVVSKGGYYTTGYHAAVWISSNGIVRQYYNGTDITETSQPTLTNNQIVSVVGAKADGENVNAATPQFVEILMWTNALSGSIRTNLDNYITARYPFTFYTNTDETILASDGSVGDVQDQIDLAVDGNVVTLPAGNFTWTSGVDITGKGITLRGAGGGRARGSSTTSLAIGTGSKTFTVQAGLGFTAGENIRAHYKASQAGNHMDGTVTSYSGTSLVLNITSVTGSGTYAAWAFQQDGATILTCSGTDDIISITEDASHNVRVEDIHFIRTSGSAIVIQIGGSGEPAVVQNCRFDMSGGRTIEMFSIHGVVARCDFRLHGVTWSGTPNNSQAISMPSVSQASWGSVSTMGTADTTGESNFYVEDCWFLGFYTETIDMDGGARIVLRTNYFDNTGLTSHGMDTGIYGIRTFEIYNNTFIHHNLSSSTAPLDYFYFIRGGTGVIASNTIPDMNTGEYGDKTEIKMTVMNLGRNGGPYPCFDTGYPAPRQIGFGRVTGSGSTDGNGYLGDSEPLYIYGNAGGYAVGLSDYPTGQGDSCATPDQVADYVVAGRDYFNNNTAKPSYTFYTYPHPLR